MDKCESIQTLVCYLVSVDGKPLLTDLTEAYQFIFSSLVCALFWFGAYVIAAWKGWQSYRQGQGRYYFPWIAISMNISWELLGALGLSSYTVLWVWLCRIAVCLNLVIITTAFLNGPGRILQPIDQLFRPLLIITPLFMLLIQYLGISSLQEVGQLIFDDSPMTSADTDAFLVRFLSLMNGYLINLAMSALFLHELLLWRLRHDNKMQEFPTSLMSPDLDVAWLKMLGTAITLPLIFLLEGGALKPAMSSYLMTMALACMGLDCVYIIGVAFTGSEESILSRVLFSPLRRLLFPQRASGGLVGHGQP